VYKNQLLTNAIKTAVYYVDALENKDFESAKLELQELKFVVNQLEDLYKSEKHQARLIEVVNELKNKGMNIDFARRSLFEMAKNAVENNQIIEKDIKKVQGA